jgi:plastocyanin
MDQLWTQILQFLSQLVIPDWGSLIAALPLGIAALIVLYLVFLVSRVRRLGPKRRGAGRITPLPPPGIHAPGPSYAPAFAAIGLFLLFFGLVFHGIALILGLVALVLTLLYWGREGVREYDHVAGTETGVMVVEHRAPPPGVHMPGPSFLPFVGALGLAALFFGLVFKGVLLGVGIIILIASLLGWLRAARVEYVLTEEADRTGHLRTAPAPGPPTRLLSFFAVLIFVAVIVDTGTFPPRSASGGTGGSPAPGGSAPAGGAASPAVPAADATIEAKGIQFTTKDVAAPAGKPFTIAFDNQDAGVPHNVVIKDASGAVKFDGGKPFNGVAVKVYDVPALGAGTYPFTCVVHPNMTGTLTVR